VFIVNFGLFFLFIIAIAGSINGCSKSGLLASESQGDEGMSSDNDGPFGVFARMLGLTLY
jgi:hypothetical protein